MKMMTVWRWKMGMMIKVPCRGDPAVGRRKCVSDVQVGGREERKGGNK